MAKMSLTTLMNITSDEDITQYYVDPNADLHIGMAGDGAQPFNGKLDEIALFKTALNGQEISNYAISGYFLIQIQKKLAIGNSTQVKAILFTTIQEMQIMVSLMALHGARMSQQFHSNHKPEQNYKPLLIMGE